MKKILQHRLFVPFLVAVLLLGVGAIFAAQHFGITPETLKGWVESVRVWLEARPVMIFAAIAVLPALPFPVSVLLVTAGVVWGERFGLPVAAGIALCAMVVNMVWTYWLAFKPGRKLIEKLLEKFSANVPELPPEQHFRLAVILRITPGIPFFVQNYALGLARVPFRTYLLVSIPAHTVWTFGFVVSGGALFSGKLGMIVAGVCLLAVAALVTQMLRKRYSATTEESA